MFTALIERDYTDIFGLAYRPRIVSKEDWNHRDMIPEAYGVAQCSGYEFSNENRRYLLDYFQAIRDTAQCIVEIGVHRADANSALTSTSVFLENKRSDTVYIGIDLDDKSWLDDASKNIYTIRGDSNNYLKLYLLMSALELSDIDFLFIDGWHSVNQAIADWKYVERLRVGGIVGIHDTNTHPGPKLLYDAIGEPFVKAKYCEVSTDWGIAFATRMR